MFDLSHYEACQELSFGLSVLSVIAVRALPWMGNTSKGDRRHQHTSSAALSFDYLVWQSHDLFLEFNYQQSDALLPGVHLSTLCLWSQCIHGSLGAQVEYGCVFGLSCIILPVQQSPPLPSHPARILFHSWPSCCSRMWSSQQAVGQSQDRWQSE